MTVNMFVFLLFAFSVITSLIMEAVKKLISDKENVSYNVVTLIIGLIVGGVGMAIYYQLSGVLYTANNIIYMVLMGLASALTATLGYDKVKQTIEQIIAYKPDLPEDK